MKEIAKIAWSDFPALDLVRTSRTIRLAGRATLISLALFVVAMLFLPWRQTATGTGTVMALDPQQRPQPVKSVAKGVVKEVKPGIREGTYVEEGTIVLELEPAAQGGVQQLDLQIAAAELKLEAAASAIQLALQQIELQESSGQFLEESFTKEIEAATSKWEQAQKEVAAEEAKRVDLANKRAIAENVAKGGIISQEELVSKRQEEEQQYQKVLKAEQAVVEAYATLEQKMREIDSKRQDIENKNLAAEQKLNENKQKYEQYRKELSELTVKRDEANRLKVPAPRSGFIQQWNGLEGSDTVKEGEQLFVIVPEADELAVEMTISGNDMPLVAEGDKVRLQFEGWPAVQFVGWPSVAIGTFGGTVNRVFPTDDGKGNFRVLVTPDNHFEREDGWPKDQYLRQGVRANGWILLRRVPLGYEIWRQLNGFPPSLKEEKGKEDKGSKVKLPKA